MIRKYKIKIHYHDYKFDTLLDAVKIIYDLDNSADDFEVTIIRVTEDDEPVAEAIRTGLNDDYPDNL